VNAHLAGGHGLQRNRLLIRAKELEQQEQEEDARAGGVNADVNNSSSSSIGSSSYGSTTSSSNSETESSTDVNDDSKLADTVAAPYVGGDADAQKTRTIPPPPPPCSTVVSTWHAFLEVADWERENKRVMKLALPYLTQAFLSGVAKAGVVAIIGKYYGTRSLSAFVVIEMTVGLTTEFFGGESSRCFLEFRETAAAKCTPYWHFSPTNLPQCIKYLGIKDATGVLATQSIGAGTTMLTGQYFQIGLILYFLIVTPFTVAWVFAVENLLLFFGFDDETVSRHLVGRRHSPVNPSHILSAARSHSPDHSLFQMFFYNRLKLAIILQRSTCGT
jgi:MatE